MTASEKAAKAAKIAAEAPDVELPVGLAALREPFDAARVGILPQPYKKDAEKGNCGVCGKWHGLPAMHLDFVGHGAVTERLLDVDPTWTWEPLALDAQGLPALDRFGNLWIRLTVCGVTRIGVGDGASMKVLIGDAIRNAAMRFGVALDLWIRGQEDDPKQAGDTLPAPAPEVLPWTRLDAMNRLFAAVKGDEADEKTNKATAGNAWAEFKGDDQWRTWEHAFLTAEVEAWVQEPGETE